MIEPLALPKASKTAVYRAMEQLVRDNPTIGRIIKPSSFRTWSGKPDDAKEFTFAIAPAMRWTPQPGPEDFRTPSMQVGPLFINCEVLLKGTNVDDLTNFWWALECVFYPGAIAVLAAGNNSVIQTLITAGAHTGLVLFTQPGFDPSPDGVWLAGQGQLKIDVRNELT